MSVVDGERQTHELRQNRRTPRPGLYHLVTPRTAQLIRFFQQIAVDAPVSAQRFRAESDLDGVEDGDQGKNRMPRDHGRDYAGDSIYPTTRAIRDLVPTWSDERLVVAVDIHCPHISGAHNEVVYLVGHNNERIAEQERVFSDVLERQRTGPLPVDATDFLAYGEAWNVGANRTQGKGFCGWAAELPSVRLVAPIEIPYANAGGAEVNQTTARAFGEDLVRALCAYLMEGQRT